MPNQTLKEMIQSHIQAHIRNWELIRARTESYELVHFTRGAIAAAKTIAWDIDAILNEWTCEHIEPGDFNPNDGQRNLPL